MFTQAPVPLLGILLLLLLWGAMQVGILVRRRRKGAAVSKEEAEEDTHEGYIVSGALGLLALLLGFTFVVDRHDGRRALVLEDANAIGTTNLRAQLLDEPYCSQISATLHEYTGNRLELAETPPGISSSACSPSPRCCRSASGTRRWPRSGRYGGWRLHRPSWTP
ncbi:hypothetical protein [Novosphingobium sp. AP12]|uniref:hypothetical protein n=1 Tax=Novosphingobium sp. AP12 TaxID=1144305 RepID=UPI000302DC23|nr:hypothetical protein [Novosphingobium sp. AP12]